MTRGMKKASTACFGMICKSLGGESACGSFFERLNIHGVITFTCIHC